MEGISLVGVEPVKAMRNQFQAALPGVQVLEGGQANEMALPLNLISFQFGSCRGRRGWTTLAARAHRPTLWVWDMILLCTLHCFKRIVQQYARKLFAIPRLPVHDLTTLCAALPRGPFHSVRVLMCLMPGRTCSLQLTERTQHLTHSLSCYAMSNQDSPWLRQ